MAAITVKELEALTPANNGKRLSMGDSMYGTVRAGRDGTVSVYVMWRFTFNGARHYLPLGTWKANGETSLKSLREKRITHEKEVNDGINPLERKAATKLKKRADQAEAIHEQRARIQRIAELESRLTVRSLFDKWQALELRTRADKGAEAKRAFERDVFPLIGELAAADVTKAHIQTIVDTMMMRDVVRMTKRVLSDLRQMFGFALDRDLVEADPTARIKKAKIGPDGERDRVLSEPELIALFDKLPASGLAETSQCALLLQLATITRIGEVLGARWEHVDFERRTWKLPRTKNGESHTLWLSDFALAQLESLKALTGLTEWLFPATRLDGPVCSKTVTKQVADRQRIGEPLSGRTKQVDALLLPGGQWRPHDLRRTGASMMADLGALPEVVERCLNHTEENKMKRIYQRARYEGPMRDAWRLLGERLELLSRKPGNVTLLHAA